MKLFLRDHKYSTITIPIKARSNLRIFSSIIIFMPNILLPCMELRTVLLSNAVGIRLELSNYGAGIVRLQVPDRNGVLTDVVVGMPSAEDYLAEEYRSYNWCMGASIGRYAGRIGGYSFVLNEEEYSLSEENGIHLHGGRNGFQNRFWEIEDLEQSETPFVIFSYKAAHLEEGYPGNLMVKAKFRLVGASLEIKYTATVDRPTVVNLTNHAYFNLEGSGSVLGNELFVNSSKILDAVDLFPTGEILDIKERRYNYKTPRSITIEDDEELDTTFVLDSGKLMASLYSIASGIKMEVFTDQPAIVVFTPRDFLGMTFRNNERYGKYPAICFECQNFPDAPNNKNFPGSVLKPGEVYQNQSFFKFSIPD